MDDEERRSRSDAIYALGLEMVRDTETINYDNARYDSNYPSNISGNAKIEIVFQGSSRSYMVRSCKAGLHLEKWWLEHDKIVLRFRDQTLRRAYVEFSLETFKQIMMIIDELEN